MLSLAFALAQDVPSERSNMAPGREVRLVRHVDPAFPHAAKKQGEVHTTCEVTVRITPEGVPDDVVPGACDEPYVANTVSAVKKWRFEADPLESGPAPAMFRVTVAYDWPRRLP